MFDVVEVSPSVSSDKSFKNTQIAQNSYFNRPSKRVLDIVFASAMLVAFAPLFALIAGSILLFDRGNPLYSQPRIGRGGKTFKCYKFRTMVYGADALLAKLLEGDPELQSEWNAARKLRKDPRVLPVIGSILRKSSLDELPQLINVLRGDMSIVGPRPIVADEMERYGADIAFYLAVRPGLTGPWQAGARSDDTYECRVRKDVDYVRNQSIARDISIIAKTAKIFLCGRAPGAY